MFQLVYDILFYNNIFHKSGRFGLVSLKTKSLTKMIHQYNSVEMIESLRREGHLSNFNVFEINDFCQKAMPLYYNVNLFQIRRNIENIPGYINLIIIQFNNNNNNNNNNNAIIME